MTSIHNGSNVPIHVQRQRKTFFGHKNEAKGSPDSSSTLKKTSSKHSNNNNNKKMSMSPNNRAVNTPQSISAPKRALQNDLLNLNDKIDSIISDYHSLSDGKDSDMSVEHTSKYQMDSIMDEFNQMSNNNKDTLSSLEKNLRTSTESTTALLNLMDEGEENGEHREALENCQHVKDYIQETLTKISSCMKHDKTLSKEEMEGLKGELEGQLNVVEGLEKEVVDKKDALTRFNKEYEQYVGQP